MFRRDRSDQRTPALDTHLAVDAPRRIPGVCRLMYGRLRDLVLPLTRKYLTLSVNFSALLKAGIWWRANDTCSYAGTQAPNSAFEFLTVLW